jgi:hypothetical protein
MKTQAKTLTVALLLVLAVVAPAADPKLTMFDVIYDMDKPSRVEQLKELIKAGADINAPVGFDRMLKQGETAETSTRRGTTWPLDVALYHERVEMVKLLLASGAKMHGKELGLAAFARNPDQALTLIKALLAAGADVNGKDGSFTALHWSSFRGNKDAVKLLLEQPGIKLDEVDADGRTALMAAVDQGHAEVVGMLLKAGANAGIADKRGQTATAIAKKNLEKQQGILSSLESRPQ